MQAKEYALYKGEEIIAMGTKREIAEQLGVSPIFSNKNDAINELHRLRGVKYRNSRMYTVELVKCDG